MAAVDVAVRGHSAGGEAVARERALVEIELASLRWPGAAMLAAGAALPLLGHPGPGCVLRAATGIPCPLCGMSTSVEESVRLQVVDAVKANPAGLVAVAIAVAALIVRRNVTMRVPMAVIYGGLALIWVFQLVRFGIV